MKKAIENLGIEGIKKLVKKFEKELKIPSHLHLDYILNAVCNNPELAPDLTTREDCKNLLDDERVEKWVSVFYTAYQNRYNYCVLKATQTKPDKALEVFMQTANDWTDDELGQAINSHRMAMSAENIIGLILELFLDEKLKAHGWALAWGSAVAHVDLCSSTGNMLQVKNRYNSENSSSKQVRKDHKIDLWYRTKSSGKDNWEKLHEIIGNHSSINSELTEEKFLQYIKELTTKIKDEKKKKAKE